MEIPQLTLPSLPKIHFGVAATRPILYFVLIIFFVFYIIVSSVLMYHWTRYGMRSHGILVGKTLYIFVSAILFLISVLSLTYY